MHGTVQLVQIAQAERNASNILMCNHDCRRSWWSDCRRGGRRETGWSRGGVDLNKLDMVVVVCLDKGKA